MVDSDKQDDRESGKERWTGWGGISSYVSLFVCTGRKENHNYNNDVEIV